MQSPPEWYYDESLPAGVDYHDTEQVAAFDANHQRFRDYEASARMIMEGLALGPEATVIDMGAGTGAFALHAAPFYRTVYAVDVSAAMLAYCRQQAEARGLANIEFHQGGFLSYLHQAAPVDGLVSVAALHHLPDYWKLIGLRRVADMLKPGGVFHLFDVVFPAEPEGYAERFNAWRDGFEAMAGPEMAAEVNVHIRDEYSTCGWIMEGLLERAGFQIASAEYDDRFGATYLCKKA